MKNTTARLLAKKIVEAHTPGSMFNCFILDKATEGLVLRNEFGRVELRRFIKVPSVNRLANLLAITFA